MASLKRFPKEDGALIWPSGVVSTNLDDLKAAFGSFSEKREKLFKALTLWIKAINEYGLRTRIWVCGSFMTNKESPGDIDLVVWPLDRVYCANNIAGLDHLFSQSVAMAEFHLDIHIEGLGTQEAFTKEAYWLGFFGFGWNRSSTRTIAEITTGPTYDGI